MGVLVRGGRWGLVVSWLAAVSAVLYGTYSYVLCLMLTLNGYQRTEKAAKILQKYPCTRRLVRSCGPVFTATAWLAAPRLTALAPSGSGEWWTVLPEIEKLKPEIEMYSVHCLYWTQQKPEVTSRILLSVSPSEWPQKPETRN